MPQPEKTEWTRLATREEWEAWILKHDLRGHPPPAMFPALAAHAPGSPHGDYIDRLFYVTPEDAKRVVPWIGVIPTAFAGTQLDPTRDNFTERVRFWTPENLAIEGEVIACWKLHAGLYAILRKNNPTEDPARPETQPVFTAQIANGVTEPRQIRFGRMYIPDGVDTHTHEVMIFDHHGVFTDAPFEYRAYRR